MNKKVIIGSVIAVVSIALIAVSIAKSSGSLLAFGGGNVFSVKVSKIEKAEISSYITSNGIIEEVERAEVFFDTPLKINKVLVKQGQKVTKGQKLLELGMDALSSQLDTLGINKSTQELSLNSNSLNAEVERNFNALQMAQRSYDNNKKAFEDKQNLYVDGTITKSELDIYEKAFIEADTGMSGLKNVQLAYQNALENRDNGKLSAKNNLKVTDLQISDLKKKILKINESVVSPIDGVVAALNAQEGSYTSTMQSAYKIINPEKLQVKANIKEYDIKNVMTGQKARISGDAIDKDVTVDGTVSNISPVAVTNRTTSGDETVVEVNVTITGTAKILKPGLNVTCDIFTVKKEGALVAPMEAITLDKDDNKLVYVVNTESGTMIQKLIKTGINSDMNVEVLDGLKEGDLVVLDPQPMFKDGAKVKIME